MNSIASQAGGCLQSGAFLIELPQNSKKSEAGKIYELENIGGLRNYRMTCIDSDDLALIPIDSRLEFITNVVSYIFQQETVSVVHMSLDDDASENVLIGLALARRFSIPLILEVRALPRHFNRIGVIGSDTVFKEMYIKKIHKCITESAAVVTHRQSTKDELLEFGVPADNVFVLPTDKILESDNFSTDNSEITTIYQKACLWALGNIANPH